MPPDFGVLTTGFARQTETECFAEIIDEARATIQADLDDSEDTVHGAQASIVSTKQGELWEVAEDVYNSFSESAEGDALDRVCALTGTTRDRPTYSTVTATVNVNPGTYAIGTIIASVVGDPSARFSNTSAVTNGGGGAAPFSVPMIAVTTGPTRASSGTLTVLENPPAGVLSITNPADADLGKNRESDGDLRIKRRQELNGAGATTIGASRARLAKVDGVKDLYVYNNRGDTPDGDGRPGHSMEAVLLGGTDNDIAAAIWATLPTGINPYSATANSGVVIDEEGNAQTVAFSRGVERRVYMRVTIKRDASTYAGDAQLKETVSDFSDGTVVLESSTGNVVRGDVRMGGLMYGSKLGSAVQTVPGVQSVVSVELDDNGAFSSPTTDYQLAVREYLGIAGTRGISTGDVTVVIV